MKSLLESTPLEAVREFLHRMLRGEMAPPNGAGKRVGYYTKSHGPDRDKRKRLRNIQKMSRVKNRA